jgi:hypothetical protein
VQPLSASMSQGPLRPLPLDRAKIRVHAGVGKSLQEAREKAD